MKKYTKKGKHQYFFGVLKKFQGLGFLISSDNAIAYSNYFLIEIRFLWLKIWYTYDL